MPTLNELIARFSFLASMPAAIGLLITAGILVVSHDWRVDVAALAVQYFFVVLLLTRLIRLEVAAVKGLTGWMICTMFYLTEQQARALKQSSNDEASQPSPDRRSWVMPARASFHLLAAISIAVVAYIAALRAPLFNVPGDIALASYSLMALGVLLIGLNESPMQIGLGLLTFLSGFDLSYVTLEPSLAVAGLLSLLNFVIALAMAYLRTAKITAQRKEEPA